MRMGDESSRIVAEAYYLMGLISAGKTQEAGAIFARMRTGSGSASYEVDRAIETLSSAGFNNALYAFLHAELVKNPDQGMWDAYIKAATRAGKITPMVELIRSAVSRPNLKAETRTKLRGHLIDALLAADKVEEGVALIKQDMAEAAKAPKGNQAYEGAGHAIKLAELGRLLNRPEWVEEGVRAAMEALTKGSGDDYGSYGASAVVGLLEKLGRLSLAEKILIEGAVKVADARMGMFSGGSSRQSLVNLAGLYYRAGRHADVLLLLDRAPNWTARDLKDIYTETDQVQTPVGFMAAKALAATGDRQRALTILEALLYAQGGYDPAYELLVDLRGAEALPFLDALYRLDQFQERPLIWKARILLGQGRLEEAEQAARQAIAVDPSDGEQGKGHRMRVYGVLADIREARGDKPQADLFRSAVRAIRLGEQADDYYSAGLLSRGVRLYEQALAQFADAYCLQSRLAVQLAAQGRHEEAEVHYRRAYELMPDSFGRMESHCFGCEGVFTGKQAEGIAERVFKELLAKTPRKPQVHYLMGYLRERQSRHKEALVHFREAVALDPDYLNAWTHIASLGEQFRLPQADRDAAALKLLRLDPQRKHAQPSLGHVANLRAVWTAVEEARANQAPPVPQSLYPMPASYEELQRMASRMREMGGMNAMSLDEIMEQYGGRGMSMVRAAEPLPKPGKIISEHSVATSIAQFVENAISTN
jgi:tetratricopeptide (TPR) repeat protein